MCFRHLRHIPHCLYFFFLLTLLAAGQCGKMKEIAHFLCMKRLVYRLVLNAVVIGSLSAMKAGREVSTASLDLLG